MWGRGKASDRKVLEGDVSSKIKASGSPVSQCGDAVFADSVWNGPDCGNWRCNATLLGATFGQLKRGMRWRSAEVFGDTFFQLLCE